MKGSSTSNSSSGGVNGLGLLQVAFVVLKLIGEIDWSWIWVLAPTWIPLAIVLLICGAVVFAAAIFK